MTLALDWWQLGWALAGFFGVIVVGLSWSISKRNSFNRGYGEGLHDRQHQETDWIVKGKLERP